MASYHLCPMSAFTQLFNDSGSAILSGALIWTYAAGTSNLTTTWTSSTGGTPNSNPIQLGSNARLNNVNIWQQDGVPIKVVFSTNAGTTLAPVFGVQIGPTFDQLTGINDPTSLLSQLSTATTGSGADLVANAMRSYDIISNVRLANAPSLSAGQTLIIGIQGASAPNDGGGGFFYWSPTSTSTDDGVNVIKPNSIGAGSPGRYLRVVGESILAFTANLTGMNATIQGTITAINENNNIVLQLQSSAITGTSNATSFSINNLPSVYQPSGTRTVTCMLEDNGALVGGWAQVSGAFITFGVGINNNQSGFTNSGTKGLPSGWTIAYSI